MVPSIILPSPPCKAERLIKHVFFCQFICRERERPPVPDLGFSLHSRESSASFAETVMSSTSVLAGIRSRKRILWAHSDILKARSEYFETMLGSSWAEGEGAKEGERHVHVVNLEDTDFGVLYWLLKVGILFRKKVNRTALNLAFSLLPSSTSTRTVWSSSESSCVLLSEVFPTDSTIVRQYGGRRPSRLPAGQRVQWRSSFPDWRSRVGVAARRSPNDRVGRRRRRRVNEDGRKLDDAS